MPTRPHKMIIEIKSKKSSQMPLKKMKATSISSFKTMMNTTKEDVFISKYYIFVIYEDDESLWRRCFLLKRQQEFCLCRQHQVLPKEIFNSLNTFFSVKICEGICFLSLFLFVFWVKVYEFVEGLIKFDCKQRKS